MEKNDSLIRTKLRPPFTRPGLVRRPRLQEQIVRGLRGPLTVITAPAGFGKTTLVTSTTAGILMAWLSLDKNDNHSGHFLGYLIAALQEVDSTIGNAAAQILAASPPAPPEAVLTSLVNDLDASSKEIILVLDDYHLISNQDIHSAVSFLLEHCPSVLHLVIVTRSDPMLPLPRMRARGQMVELRAADLRFTGPEAAQFLNEVMGLCLDADAIAALEERTEGWIAGLQMAALSMRHHEDIPGFIKGFSGTNRYILDYLLEEVLANQPPEIQHFLLYTSVLDRLSAPLCDAMLEAGGRGKDNEGSEVTFNSSFSILQYLERANLFLIPLDDKRVWYRYHHLFADLLINQLKKVVGTQIITQLHQRAAEWYEQNSSIIEAIHHASMAADDEKVERLIEQNYLEMMNRGEMSWVRYWMGNLNKELIFRRPWLCMYEALNRSWFGQIEEAKILLNAAEKSIQATDADSDRQAMMGYHAYVKSRVTAMLGDTRQAIELCLLAHQKIPANNLAQHNEVDITLGLEYFLYGDFENASKVLSRTIQAAYKAQAINNPVAAYAILARIEALQGQLQAAENLLEKAAQLVREANGPYLGATGLIEIGAADLMCEWNNLDAALVRVQKGLDLLPNWGKTDDTCLAYVTLYRILRALGNRKEAVDAIEKAAQCIRSSCVFSEASNAVETNQVKMWLEQEAWLPINHWIAAFEKRTDCLDSIQYEDELAHITRARVFIAQNKLSEAIQLLSRLEEFARTGKRRGRLLETLLLKALAQRAAGNNAQAEIDLTQSLAIAEPGGYVRVFLDEGPSLRKLIIQWMSHAGNSPLQGYAVHLLSQFEPEPEIGTPDASPAGPDHTLIEQLSQRELEVLQLIAMGMTNQQIARQLIISPGTVKAHTASIFRKLGVANRTEAVACARRLGILS